MNPVVVRNVKIGEGIPKICVPIVGVTREEILAAGARIREIGADVAEWRADWYEDVFHLEKTRVTCPSFLHLEHQKRAGKKPWKPKRMSV